MAYLIINADDFGYRRLYNQKILELIEQGHITSTSAMVRRIDEKQSDQVARLKQLAKTQDATVGLHAEFSHTDFLPQLQEQVDLFQRIFGFEPDFIDIHKSTYLPDGYPVIMQFCAERGIPCKNLGLPHAQVIMTKEPTYDGTGQTFAMIESWLKSLQPNETYLIAFHPGIYDPESKSKYNEIREKDAEMVVRLHSILAANGIHPVNFRHLKPTT